MAVCAYLGARDRQHKTSDFDGTTYLLLTYSRHSNSSLKILFVASISLIYSLFLRVQYVPGHRNMLKQSIAIARMDRELSQ